jgi:hypothetical protein
MTSNQRDFVAFIWLPVDILPGLKAEDSGFTLEFLDTRTHQAI